MHIAPAGIYNNEYTRIYLLLNIARTVGSSSMVPCILSLHYTTHLRVTSCFPAEAPQGSLVLMGSIHLQLVSSEFQQAAAVLGDSALPEGTENSIGLLS